MSVSGTTLGVVSIPPNERYQYHLMIGIVTTSGEVSIPLDERYQYPTWRVVSVPL